MTLWITLIDKFFLFVILLRRFSKIFMTTLTSQSMQMTESQTTGSFVIVKLNLLIK